MKHLLIILILLSTNLYAEQSPQQILKSSGFVLVVRENGKEIYYRPKEVQRFNGIVYYSTTIFFTKPVNGMTKYSMRSDYMALACKERKVLKTGIHTVPYIGSSSYQDLLKQGVKDSSFKTLNSLDKTMYSKVCQSYTL